MVLLEFDGNRGPFNQLYQVVLAYLGKREPDRAVKHLFATDVGVRNLPSPRLFNFRSIEEIEALQKAVSEVPTGRHDTREKVLGILMAEPYRLGGQDGLRGFCERKKREMVVWNSNNAPTLRRFFKALKVRRICLGFWMRHRSGSWSISLRMGRFVKSG